MQVVDMISATGSDRCATVQVCLHLTPFGFQAPAATGTASPGENESVTRLQVSIQKI